jgi:CRP-like cAMP-binding protein
MKGMPIDWEKLTGEHPALGAIPGVLRDSARIRAFEKGQVLYRRGQSPQVMLCVLGGEIRLVRHAPRGAEIVLQRSHSGFVAEASLDAQTYHCDVVAATDGQLLLFPRASFQAALENEPAFNRAWTQLLAREVRRLRAHSERLSLNSAAARIIHYIEAEGSDGTIMLNQTRKSWAVDLGLTHEVLYRTLRQLRESGDIVVDGERISLRVQRLD